MLGFAWTCDTNDGEHTDADRETEDGGGGGGFCDCNDDDADEVLLCDGDATIFPPPPIADVVVSLLLLTVSAVIIRSFFSTSTAEGMLQLAPEPSPLPPVAVVVTTMADDREDDKELNTATPLPEDAVVCAEGMDDDIVVQMTFC